MSAGEATLQNIVDHGAQVLRGGNSFGKLRKQIEVLAIKPFDDLRVHEAIQLDQVANHARTFIHRPADCDLQPVVMAVSVGIIAFAISGRVLRGRHAVAVQAVRGREPVTPRQIRLHASP